MKKTTLEQLSEEEFSPAQLLPESNDEIIKLLNEPRPYRVIGEVFPIDVDTDAMGNVAPEPKLFSNKMQNDFKADFGFMAPHKTKVKCKNPVFGDPYLHRIAIMKDEHFGSKGDRDENGLSGYVSKFICTGCGKRYKVDQIRGFFHTDKL